ncbi:4-hydroxy-3-methylbut-2-enyl diphosphate reductase [Thermodesulfobacteriota bacterium]
MKVLLAKHAGFCMGVRRAVETTIETIRKEDEGIATFGPLIHNPQVIELLKDQGVEILQEIPQKQSGTVIIRAHGVPPEKKEQLAASGAHVQDATCPRVVKVQVIINKYRKQGYRVVIIGDRNHAEVEGLMGYAGKDCLVVSAESDIDQLRISGPYIIVCQTTQDELAFEELSQEIVHRFPEGKIFNTICDSTHKRQEEVRELSKKVQAMVVVGGRTSANTKRLGEIAAGMGCPVFMVETENDLDLKALADFDCVGVTAGASTPSWMINWVVRALESVPGKSEGSVLPYVKKVFWFLLATNTYVSIGGGMLSYAFVNLLTGMRSFDGFWISFGYLFAMHNLNRFTDQKSRKINDPLRVQFYRRFRWPFLVCSAVILAGSLTIAYKVEWLSFLLLAGMSILGVLYSVRFIPKPFTGFTRVRGLKEIPGSKTVFVSLAWAFVVVLVPILGVLPVIGIAVACSFFIVLLLAYIRCALFDVLDIQGDRIVGKETLPVIIGEKKSLVLLQVMSVLLIVFISVVSLIGWLPMTALWLIPGGGYLALLVYFSDRKFFSARTRLEFGMESGFIMMGIILSLGILLQA